MAINMKSRITPDYIEELKENEIFVFGSNTPGLHVVGTANIAHIKWGAKWGKGAGLQGRSYAIPTVGKNLDVVKQYIDKFIEFAKEHEELTFLVTPITDAGAYHPHAIAPMFNEAKNIENIHLPISFWQYIS